MLAKGLKRTLVASQMSFRDHCAIGGLSAEGVCDHVNAERVDPQLDHLQEVGCGRYLVRSAEELHTSAGECKIMEPWREGHIVWKERHKPVEGVCDIPLARPRPSGIEVNDRHRALIDEDEIIWREVIMADNLVAGGIWEAELPYRIRARSVGCRRIVELAEQARRMHNRLLGPDIREDADLAGQECQDLTPLRIDTAKARRPSEVDALQVLEEPLDGRAPRPTHAANRVTDTNHTCDISTAEGNLIHDRSHLSVGQTDALQPIGRQLPEGWVMHWPSAQGYSGNYDRPHYRLNTFLHQNVCRAYDWHRLSRKMLFA
jgi:hypothetical protein